MYRNLANNVFRFVRFLKRTAVERELTHPKHPAIAFLATLVLAVFAAALAACDEDAGDPAGGSGVPNLRLAFRDPDVSTPAPGAEPRLIEALQATASPSPSPVPETATPQATALPQTAAPQPEPTDPPAPPPQPPPAPAAAIAPVNPPTPAPAPAPPGGSDSGLAAQMIDLINARRAAGGVPALTVHGALTGSAQDYAALHFAQPDPFQLSHNLDGSPGDRIRRYGYNGGAAETLVIGQPDAAALLDVWLNSPIHLDIIMDPRYQHIGVGCQVGWYDGAGSPMLIALCVADFGYQ